VDFLVELLKEDRRRFKEDRRGLKSFN